MSIALVRFVQPMAIDAMNGVWLRIPLADHAALDDALAAAGGRAETRPAIRNGDLPRSSAGLFIEVD